MKILLTTGLLLILLLPVSQAMADNSADLFVQKCGQCHYKGAEAKPVNPADKAGVIWEKYFKRDRHPCAWSETISSSEKQVILNFLKEHAADSDRPMAAVIPK